MANTGFLRRQRSSSDDVDPFFPHFSQHDDVFSDTESVILNPDPDSQVSFVTDLFPQRVENSQFVSDSAYDMALDNSDLDFGLAFDNSAFHNHDSSSNNHSVAGDDFCVDRVESGPTVGFCSGLRVVGFGSESESEGINEVDEDDYCLDRVSFGNNLNYDSHDDDNASVTIPLCWDSLQLEDHREGNEDFEWVVDEREVLNMFNDDEEASVSLSISPIIAPEDMVSVEQAGGLGNLEWEVLLNAHNLDTNPDQENDGNAEPYFAEQDDYIYTGEYETLFGQFVENEMALMGRPPAAKSVVEKLPFIVLTQEDVESGNSLCAVCKDDINVGEKAKQLPCSHRYHGECIVPWLGIRNTCPVCRHELPTDDVEYERRKATQRAVVSGHHM